MTPERQEAIEEYWRALTGVDPIRLQSWDGRGLTMPQLRLMHLVWRGGGMSAGDVAGEMRVSPAAVTGLTTRLLKQGLLKREEDDGDRRLKRFWLTPAGEVVLGQISVAAHAYMEAVLDRMGEKAVEQFATALREFNEAAEALQSEGEHAL